jgi:DNA-binding XRE family transcriptional regulator
MRSRPIINIVEAEDNLTLPSDALENFCDVLDYLLRYYEMSNLECGKRAGISGKTIFNVRTNTMAPSIENAAKIASAFDLQLWQMLVPLTDRTIVPTHDYVVSFRRWVERGVHMMTHEGPNYRPPPNKARTPKKLTAVG